MAAQAARVEVAILCLTAHEMELHMLFFAGGRSLATQSGQTFICHQAGCMPRERDKYYPVACHGHEPVVIYTVGVLHAGCLWAFLHASAPARAFTFILARKAHLGPNHNVMGLAAAGSGMCASRGMESTSEAGLVFKVCHTSLFD